MRPVTAASGTKLLWTLACLAACCAALVAHFGIDAVGDYLPGRDTYDYVPHASRIVALLGALGIGTCLVARLFGAVCDDVRGGTQLAASLCAISRRSAPLFVGRIVVLTMLALIAMGALDERLTGGSAVTLRELLGGSLLVGLSIAFACGIAAGIATWALVSWLSAARGKLVATVVALLRALPSLTFRPVYAHRELLAPIGCSAAAVASRGGKRGPPALHFA
jgi:hypothetical protein